MLSVLREIPNVWAEKIQQVSIVGTPDILCCVGGHFVAIELKSSGGAEPTGLQAWKLKQVAKAGGKSYTLTPDNFLEVINEVRKLSRKEII